MNESFFRSKVHCFVLLGDEIQTNVTKNVEKLIDCLIFVEQFSSYLFAG